MSGRLYRDTRFSNKQAKLPRSSDLDNLVDMTKVKMYVMTPWIEERLTKLLGRANKYLYDKIYDLLKGKAVNGNSVRVLLAGYLGNDGAVKFVKELWAHLLSAQQNGRGVPQQFLDAKKEETKKKKAEKDHITNEIQRKKEKENQELEEEKAKMDGDGAQRRDKNSDLKPKLKHDAGGSVVQPAADKERYRRNGRRRSSSLAARRVCMSFFLRLIWLHSVRRRSRSFSGSPQSRSYSISPEKQDRSAPRRSMTPRRRNIIRRSPSSWHGSSHLRRSSRSPSPCRSPSSARYRVHSPRSHRSRSTLRCRSRSHARFRSRSPLQRRSPTHSPAERTRHGKYSAARRAPPNERAELPAEVREGKNSVERRPVVSLRSPQRDMLDRSEGHGKPRKQSPSVENSPVGSDASRGRSDSEERRPMSPHNARRRIVQPESPCQVRKAVEPKAHRRSSGTSVDERSNFSNREMGESRYRSSGKSSPMPVRHKDQTDSVEIHDLADRMKSRKNKLPNSVKLCDRRP